MLLHFFYDWINTLIKSITQLSKPSLKEQNIGPDLHHYKHMSTSHFLRNNTHSDLQNTKHICIHYTQKDFTFFQFQSTDYQITTPMSRLVKHSHQLCKHI